MPPQITQVSDERIRDELTKLLTEGAARRGFELLDETGLLSVVLPDIARMKGVEQPPQFHPEGDVWIHTLMLLEKLPTGCSPTLAWGFCCTTWASRPRFRPPLAPGTRIRFNGHEEIGVRMAESICRGLRFSNEETEQVESLVANHMRFKDVLKMRPRPSNGSCACRDSTNTWNCTGSTVWRATAVSIPIASSKRFLLETPVEKVYPPKLVTGDDLKDMGLVPGPRFREILNAVEEAQLDGKLQDRESAIEFARSLGKD